MFALLAGIRPLQRSAYLGPHQTLWRQAASLRRAPVYGAHFAHTFLFLMLAIALCVAVHRRPRHAVRPGRSGKKRAALPSIGSRTAARGLAAWPAVALVVAGYPWLMALSMVGPARPAIRLR